MQNHIGSCSIAKKTWANVAAVLLATAICQGNVSAQTPRLRLGTPQVLSPLGSPLQVRVPIDVSADGESLSSSRFSLGARPPNAALPFIERAEVTVESTGDRVELVIRTRTAIEEPAIGIVIREQLSNGVRSREFFLLLDSPSLVVARSPERRAELATVTSPPAGIAAAPRPTDAKPATTPSVDTKKTLRASKPAPSAAAAVPSSNGVVAARPTPEQLSFKAPAYTEGGPRLRLSGGGDLTSMPATTEAEREILRARQFTLDTDDLTSVLLKREHRILQLEKELAGLAARVSVAERVIGATAIPPTVQKTASQAAAPDTTAPKPALATNVANVPQGDDKLASWLQSSLSWRTWLMVLAAFALLTVAVRRLRSKSGGASNSIQLNDNREEEFAADVLSHEATGNAASNSSARAEITASPAKPLPVQKNYSAPIPAATESKDFSPPEIHFELPELSQAASDAIRNTLSADPQLSTTAPNVNQLPLDSPTMRKMRELQSHYPDISRLAPRVDLPRSMLQQAVTVYEQGEVEFAKRLLAFAAYSSPNSEAYWLALLELLYREKHSRDYLFNANLFHEIHEKSIHWDEVARIGYLLNPTEALFAVASTWSHDPPVLGSWLPTSTDNSPPPARRTRSSLQDRLYW